MFRQRANLISVYGDLSDRYGHDDPIVVQLQAVVDRRQTQAKVLPLGERRKVNLPSHLWTRSLRDGRSVPSDPPGL